MKMRPIPHANDTPYGVRWECPGCRRPHTVPTTGPDPWGFNGDLERPTLTPSVLVHPHGFLAEDGTVRQTPRCHVHIRDGRIEFLSDCTHALAGQTIDMLDVSESTPSLT